jgi:magnesium transporter
MAALLGVAAEHATRRVPIAAPSDHVGAVRERLVDGPYDAVEDVVVLDEERVVGLVPIEILLASPSDVRVDAVMDLEPPVVGPHTDQARVAHQMVDRAECSIAVVDADDRFVGLIPPHRMLAVLLSDYDRSLARLGGYASRGREARTAAEEPVRRRIWHRLPWLLVGLVGAMLSAVVMASFETQLERNVLIAFFVPAVVYMADAVGTQTETVLIRAMATGVTARSIARREITSGVVIGMLVASAFFLFALAAWGDASVATAVALALVASCSIASLVALVLPAVLRYFDQDPAFGAGPLATVVQDLLSVVVYLAIASVLAA